MLSDQETTLAAAAASALCTALSGADGSLHAASVAVERVFPGLHGAPTGADLARAHRELRDAGGPGRDRARLDLERDWRASFEDLLRQDPDARARLATLLADLGALDPEGPPAPGRPGQNPPPTANVPIQLNFFAPTDPAGHRAAAGRHRLLLWQVPPRNRSFTGRQDVLDDLRARLRRDHRAVVQALRGWGGVGKTQIAVEFAHRNSGDYGLICWIDAERTDLIGEQYAELAIELKVAEVGADTPTAVRAVRSHLQHTADWLVIFDNAESPHDLVAWLPQGPGHVIITSRHQRWGELARPVDVDVLQRAESIALLRTADPALDAADADRLAEQLGDLPLALAQAGGYLTETGCRPAEYLDSLAARAPALLNTGQPTTYPRSLVATVALATKRLSAVDPAALGMMLLCAFLAPEPVPLSLLALARAPRGAADDPFARLAALSADDPVALRQCIGTITNFGMGKPSTDGIVLHRLTQAIVRAQLTADEAERARSMIDDVLVAADPGDPAHPASWTSWARLLPHLLAVDPAGSANPALRALACNATWYLLTRAVTEPGLAMATALYERWLSEDGPDDYYTMWAANSVARAWYDLGEVRRALALHEDTYLRRRRLLGPDDQQTLISANNVARDLRAAGEAERARQVDEDTYDRRRRLLGPEHLHTLISGINLARDLRILGRTEEACALDEVVLERRRRTLGQDHPHTLDSSNSLARDLFALNRPAEARSLDENVLARRLRVLGQDHPHTLDSAHNLARDLFALGEVEQAYHLDQDTYARRQRVLGDAHHDTQISRRHVLADQAALGNGEVAS
ncbi:FxSxx-COOH system tetratricopeptide repeat protein [Streptomyces sp. NPDC006733]|uniref:FxSxx-COOH system tetratricopeptide repeat protein n=1 Tax=Streptomyces sp. NPDC006733 TaxID=3155460 RepID=UPI0033CFF192